MGIFSRKMVFQPENPGQNVICRAGPVNRQGRGFQPNSSNKIDTQPRTVCSFFLQNRVWWDGRTVGFVRQSSGPHESPGFDSLACSDFDLRGFFIHSPGSVFGGLGSAVARLFDGMNPKSRLGKGLNCGDFLPQWSSKIGRASLGPATRQ